MLILSGGFAGGGSDVSLAEAEDQLVEILLALGIIYGIAEALAVLEHGIAAVFMASSTLAVGLGLVLVLIMVAVSLAVLYFGNV